ncbi:MULTISPECIES: hypothetical protein [unclassified Oceanispirochaeta]|uniref:hypothetical protein n=1 Tax=unclassified Oceanispirochaeta TaxID=2635722 RepID=UPI000E08F4BA|nr:MULTISPECIES: hypothetical protein [unclassified Oceanispirochaeta]MBF9017217.1 hypothetical protein [Oceanispirochaeta sp. M2]NPD73666.1 hypothetical protein [Oceanispirochaeta sp. M1]RDG30596.1 hypothetical protein DV872_16360 [Oceanispirochaeta sp. M1]
MSEKVHYEDNLFYLHTEITNIQNGLKLSIDSEFFASRIVQQIFAVDTVLNRHYTLLKENPYLIRRNDFLFSIQKLKTKLAALIEFAEEKKGFFSEKDRERFPELKRKMALHLEDVQSIRREISENLRNSTEDNSSLSSSEYELLMQQGED